MQLLYTKHVVHIRITKTGWVHMHIKFKAIKLFSENYLLNIILEYKPMPSTLAAKTHMKPAHLFSKIYLLSGWSVHEPVMCVVLSITLGLLRRVHRILNAKIFHLIC
jgi:hypothetical protein